MARYDAGASETRTHSPPSPTGHSVTTQPNRQHIPGSGCFGVVVAVSCGVGNFADRRHAARVTAGCATGPLRYCPDRSVTRAQMATFLARALGVVEVSASVRNVDGGLVALPGEGVDVTAARANWSSGYFQAEMYKLLLEELGYNVSDPALRRESCCGAV